jgi:hypothetical protein
VTVLPGKSPRSQLSPNASAGSSGGSNRTLSPCTSLPRRRASSKLTLDKMLSSQRKAIGTGNEGYLNKTAILDYPYGLNVLHLFSVMFCQEHTFSYFFLIARSFRKSVFPFSFCQRGAFHIGRCSKLPAFPIWDPSFKDTSHVEYLLLLAEYLA